MSFRYLWEVLRSANTGETPIPRDYHDCIRMAMCGASARKASGRLEKMPVKRELPPYMEEILGIYAIEFESPPLRVEICESHGSVSFDNREDYAMKAQKRVDSFTKHLGGALGVDIAMENSVHDIFQASEQKPALMGSQ